MSTPIVLPKTYDNFAAMRSLADSANHQKRLTGGIVKSETGFQINGKMQSLYVDVKAKGNPIVSTWQKLTGTRTRQVQASRVAIKNILISAKRMSGALENESDRKDLNRAIQDIESLLEPHAPGGARSSSLIKVSELQPHFETILNVHKVYSEEAAKRSKPAEARIAEMLPKIEERVRAAKEPSKLELKDICAAFIQKIYPSGDQKSVLDNVYASLDTYAADESERGELTAKMESKKFKIIAPDANSADNGADFLQAQLDAKYSSDALAVALGAKGSTRRQQFMEKAGVYLKQQKAKVPERLHAHLDNPGNVLEYLNLGRPLGMSVENFLKCIPSVKPKDREGAAFELSNSIPHIFNQLHYAQEMLTNTEFLDTMSFDLREPLRSYGESLQAMLVTMTNPTGPVMVALRMAEAVVHDSDKALAALKASREAVGNAG